MIRLPSAEATEQAGQALASLLRVGDVVALSGNLGAGKTTFARGVLRGLGFAGEVASPTFPIVQTYEPPEIRLPLWHADLYRIENAEEIVELALDEALDHGALVIEWPDRLPSLWPQTLRLALASLSAEERALTVIVPPAWEGRWPPQ